MVFLQWLLFIATTLFTATLFIPQPIQWPSLIVFAIAAAIVCPLLDSQIQEKLSFLKSKFLRIFLCIVLWFLGALLGASTSVSFDNLAVCNQPTQDLCEQHDIAFLEGQQTLQFSAELSAGTRTIDKAMVTLEYWAEPGQEEQALSEIINVQPDKDEQLFQLENVNLIPGNYRLTLEPQDSDQYSTLGEDRQFSVWTDPIDVTNRNGEEIENVGLHNSISSLRACEGNGDVQDPCEEHFQELSYDIPILHLSAEIPGFQGDVVRTRGDSEITFILRYIGVPGGEKVEPELIFRETSELDRNIGTYTLIIDAPEGGFAEGEFELIASLETRSSKPIRKFFALKAPES